jgi:Shikimate kinase
VARQKLVKILSKKIGARFIDLDAEIEHFYSKSISQIFDDLGEIEFRKIERSILLKILDYDDFYILSLGGGTPCYFDNMELINKKTNLTFFLNLESKILAERLFSRKSTRPIIKSINNESEMLSFVNKHLFERNTYYSKANYTINSNKRDVKKICDEILKILEKNGL